MCIPAKYSWPISDMCWMKFKFQSESKHMFAPSRPIRASSLRMLFRVGESLNELCSRGIVYLQRWDTYILFYDSQHARAIPE